MEQNVYRICVLENYKVLVKDIKADPSQWRDTPNASRLLSELCPRPPPSPHRGALQVTRAPSMAMTVGGHSCEAPLVSFPAPRVMCELASGPDSLFQSTLLQLINSTNTSWAPTRDRGYGRADSVHPPPSCIPHIRTSSEGVPSMVLGPLHILFLSSESFD